MDHVISDHESCIPRSSCCSEVELATFNQVRRDGRDDDRIDHANAPQLPFCNDVADFIEHLHHRGLWNFESAFESLILDLYDVWQRMFYVLSV